jgi:hypothetical protein
MRLPLSTRLRPLFLVLLVACGVAEPAFGSSSHWPPASELTAGDGGRALDLPGSIRLQMTPGTRLRFVRSIRLALLPGAPGTLCDVLSLVEGRVDVVVPNRRPLERSVLVMTPRRVGGVPSGGWMTVTARSSGSSVVNRDGQMVSAVGANWIPLQPGLARTVSGPNSSGQPERMAAGPAVFIDRPLGFKIGDARTAFRVHLLGGATATRYLVRVWRADSGAPTLVRTLEASGPELEVTGLEPGSYLVQAESENPDGTVSQLSLPRAVRIVGLSVPAGARVVGATIELGRDQMVALDDPTGLEVSHGGAATFVSAPRTLGLWRDGPTLVRLRQLGRTEETELRLVPREIRARIEITPRRAVWPGQNLTIVIWLEDGRGRQIDGIDSHTVDVAVNGEPVTLDWNRSDDLLVAHLPGRPMPGPWVVRVEVRAASGNLVGRESLEIAPRHPRPRMWRHRTVVRLYDPLPHRIVKAQARLSAT